MPETYEGDLMKYPDWQDEMKDFLEDHDSRWRKLMDSREEHTCLLAPPRYVKIGLNSNTAEHVWVF